MSHEDIEVALEDAHKLTEKLSLLAFGDAGRTGDLYSHLNNKYGAWATDLVKELNAGAHGDASVEAIDAMVGTTARFVELLDPQKRE